MVEPETTSDGKVNDPAPATPRWRPGDDRPDIGSMIRVDQAGEYGATRIYCGQQAVFGARHPATRLISRMQVQEERHLRHFDEMMIDRGVRPTLLQPFWKLAGYGLGVATALLGPDAAMACTAAIETEIDKHYGEQLAALNEEKPDLSEAISEFRSEECEHRDTAIASGAENAFGYPILSGLIRAGCRVAIELSKRI